MEQCLANRTWCCLTRRKSLWKSRSHIGRILGPTTPCCKGARRATQRARPCYCKNKAKALNHWAGDRSGVRDVTATIRVCYEAHSVPGLVAYARQEIQSKLQAREAKEEQRRQQVEKDSAREGHRDSQSGATMASGASLSQAGSGEGSVSKR